MNAFALASCRFGDGHCEIRSNLDALDQLPLPPDVHPIIIAMLGKTEKSIILRKLLLDHVDYQPISHKKLYLWTEPGSSLSDTPIILLDSELHVRALRKHLDTSPDERHEPGQKISCIPARSQEHAYRSVASHLITPLSSVIVIMFEDFSSWDAIAQFVAQHAIEMPENDVMRQLHPTVVVIVQFPPADFDVQATEHSLRTDIRMALSDINSLGKVDMFDSTQIVALEGGNQEARATAVRNCITRLQTAILEARRASRLLFSWRHLKRIMQTLMGKLCQDPFGPFSLVRSCTPSKSDHSEFCYHLSNMLRMATSAEWQEHVIAPHVASCIMLATYPPGAHRT